MLKQRNNPNILTTPYHYSAEWDGRFDAADFPDLQMPLELQSATPGKQASYAAGRFCAAKAIALLNQNFPTNVGRDKDGAPRWPTGLVGSITHTNDFVSAAVALAEHAQNIGIDSERIVDAPRLEDIKRIALREDERHNITTWNLSEAQAVTLIFSAKESVYKCLCPIMKCPVDFSDVGIGRIDTEKNEFFFELPEKWKHVFPSLRHRKGRFQFESARVHTAMELNLLDESE